MIVPRTPQYHADVAGHYDELDRVYREIWGEHVHHGLWMRGDESVAEATDALTDLVGERLGVGEGAGLVDIGCGYGASAARLARRLGVRVTGFTLSAEQHRVAAARPGALTFHVRDWLDNGLPDAAFDGGFDGAYAIESSEHIADKPRFFAEAARVLRPGARLVVCAWLAADAPTRWQVDHLLEPICREGRLPGMGTREEYEDMGVAAGLTVERYEDVSAQVARTWSICARRFAARVATDGWYRRLMLSRDTRNRSFALSVPRLMLAYRTGAMRYGVFTFAKA